MKILITPNHSAPYDQRMVNGLASGFHVVGHEAHALPTPISAAEVAQKCKDLSIDVVIQVNRTRNPDIPLPPKVRHISWFQDVFPETTKCFAEKFHDSDILYALGDAEVLGLDAQLPCYVGSLVSGVDISVIDYRLKFTSYPVDFSLCGFIPPPPVVITYNFWTDILALTRCNPLLGTLQIIKIARKMFLGRYLRSYSLHNKALVSMMETVRKNYRPLRGELDIHKLTHAMREAITSLEDASFAEEFGAGGPAELLISNTKYLIELLRGNKDSAHQRQTNDFNALTPFEKSINYFARDYPRLLDRVALINGVLQVSNSLELYGPGWNMHPEFSPYAKGVIGTQNGLLDVYLNSRINLANNTHGLGLHSRTLECMAVGGFVLTHESPHDRKPGGMLTSFEPGVHYGVFTLGNLHEEAHRWLADNTGRRRAGQQAAEVVRQRHCWHHRAQQILDDLKK